MKKRVVLMYSGGLDTSVILKWLSVERSYEVIALCVDIGQVDDLSDVRRRAFATGAAEVVVMDQRERFLSEFCVPALAAGAAYEDAYLLAAPLARPLIAQCAVETATAFNAVVVAHGATGKGNDQVRFYSSVVALAPHLEVLAPAMDWDLKSREDEIAYAERHGIPLATTSGSSGYSEDSNIWGCSIECGPLDDLSREPSPSIYVLTHDPRQTHPEGEEIEIMFERGVPMALNGCQMTLLKLVTEINAIAGRNGIGRIDIVENRVVGIKTRGVYEAPAATCLRTAFLELQNLCLDRDSLHFMRHARQRYSELVYYGLWFSPLRIGLQAMFDHFKTNVNGTLGLRLCNGRIEIRSRNAGVPMYHSALSTYGAGDIFDHSAGQGFSYIWSMPLRVAAMAGRDIDDVQT